MLNKCKRRQNTLNHSQPQESAFMPSIETLMRMYDQGVHNPTAEQWQTFLGGDMSQPLTVTNFFKLRETADPAIIEDAMTGQEAFDKYAETSVPKVSSVGGSFALIGRFESGFIGVNDESWDIVAVASYPTRESFLELLLDTDYIEAFKYRQAAVANQQVSLVQTA